VEYTKEGMDDKDKNESIEVKIDEKDQDLKLVEEIESKPIFTTRILGTKYMYLIIVIQLLVYSGSIFIVISNNLLKLKTLDAEDYFDQNDIETKIFFT
jgi:hypothetical protein